MAHVNGAHRVIALVDWNQGGHHEMYLRAYVSAFLAQGLSVVVLCRDPGALAIPTIAWAGRVTVREIPGMAWLKSRRWVTPPVALSWFARRVAAALRSAEKEAGRRCERMFFSCLYESQARVAMELADRLGMDAAGLYLHAGVFHAGGGKPAGRRAVEVTRLLRHPRLRRLFVLDEGMAAAVAECSGKPVVVAPDFTDTRLASDAAWGEGLSNGRTVGVLGHLRPSKGVATLARLAVEHPEIPARFLFAGEMSSDAFSPEERSWIERARALGDRVIFLEGRIPDEGAYNALVRSCDVLWAVYPKTPHSSNTLTKAAVFERPVLVAEGYLMAKQTREYRLGEVVDPDNLPEIAEKLRRLLDAGPAGWSETARPRWAEFRDKQSEARLIPLLAEWLST